MIRVTFFAPGQEFAELWAYFSDNYSYTSKLTQFDTSYIFVF